MKKRIEHDFLGELELFDDVYYGIQTARALENFQISTHRLYNYPFFIKALAQVKKAAASANWELGLLDSKVADCICRACDRIISGEFNSQFAIDMMQGGAGTSTNMNINEVVANVALEIMGKNKGEYEFIHPNDHVNLGQSTNDAYPSSIKVAVIFKLRTLLDAMKILKSSLDKKASEYKDIIKMGRTELEDAVPTTLGNTFRAFSTYIASDMDKINLCINSLSRLNLGGTAIGTGINCHPSFKFIVNKKLNEITGENYEPADDLIAATQDTADFVFVSGVIKTAATRLSKIANDLRLMNSGPRTGLREINLPKLQPGSSIMPGKINPVIPEVVAQACYEIMGNDLNIALCSQRAEFELNAFEPGIAYAIFNSIILLENAMLSLAKKCIDGITANKESCLNAVLNSVGIVTAFNPYIGYEKSSKVAKEALDSGKNVGEIVVQNGYLTKEQVDEILNLENMLSPHMTIENINNLGNK